MNKVNECVIVYPEKGEIKNDVQLKVFMALALIDVRRSGRLTSTMRKGPNTSKRFACFAHDQRFRPGSRFLLGVKVANEKWMFIEDGSKKARKVGNKQGWPGGKKKGK
jgi:hypothetical protein